jgi:multiple sugar transport system substrate-binding protein
MVQDRSPPDARRLPALCPVTLICALICALLAGCAQIGPPPEPATIAFVFPDVDTEYYEALLPEFNQKHPEITVELRPDPYEDEASLELESADVVWVYQYLGVVLSQENKLLSLDSLVEQDEDLQLSAFYPTTVDAFSYEGETWAVPLGIDMWVMYYNPDLFDEYNVPYPEMGWTWDDFLQRAIALRDPDAFVFGYGPRLHLPDALAFVYQHGGRIFDDLENPTRTTFDDPLTIEALDWYARMVHDHDAAPSLNQSSHAYQGGSFAIYDGILTGKVGMWMGVLSERGGMTWPMKWKMAWKMVPLPSGQQSATIAEAEGVAITSSTEHPDACWAWIAWLSEQVPHRTMPARPSLAESSAYEKKVGAEVAQVARAAIEHAQVANQEALLPFEGAFETYQDGLEEILQGFQTPLEAMTEAQRQAPRAAP